ncbi:MSMEG_0570 family protein [Williamsia maris]|uniref:MSMEG_0570 family protein n=2 Tax=Williamsia maris TaxID=72806 RepID=A0ABT1HK21_9NOCA|nr:MSMEG_0570 family protein [Williamsia maris]
MTFEVRWPDGAVENCYSPSLVMHDHLTAGASYTVAEFVDRSTTALSEASERVRAKYGFACTSAAATTHQIITSAARYPDGAKVDVVSMSPPL